jgi:hypothetical protein
MKVLMDLTFVPGFWLGLFVMFAGVVLIIGIADHEIKKAYEKL